MEVENPSGTEQINWTSNDGVFRFISQDENLQKIEVYSLQGKKLLEKESPEPVKILHANLSAVPHQVLIVKLELKHGKTRIIKIIR